MIVKHSRHYIIVTIQELTIPWKSLLTSLPVYAIFVGSFSRNWVFAMMIVELPQYFKDIFKLNIADVSIFTPLSSNNFPMSTDHAQKLHCLQIHDSWWELESR